MQEHYLTSAIIHCRCRVVFLRSFISALFLYFFRFIPTLYLKRSFAETFSLVYVLFWGFQTYWYFQIHVQLMSRKSLLLTSKYETTLQTNTFITSDKIVFKLRTHMHKNTGSITLPYSPPSMLSHCRHPQVIYTCICNSIFCWTKCFLSRPS